jgi:hypothetical protein
MKFLKNTFQNKIIYILKINAGNEVKEKKKNLL